MAFSVEVSDQAVQDADEILGWLLSEHAGDTGIRWFVGLSEAIQSLSDFPERCPLAAESIRFPFEVRQLLYGNRPHVYRILFTIDGDVVNILHIRHGRRRPMT